VHAAAAARGLLHDPGPRLRNKPALLVPCLLEVRGLFFVDLSLPSTRRYFLLLLGKAVLRRPLIFVPDLPRSDRLGLFSDYAERAHRRGLFLQLGNEVVGDVEAAG
jgi:hypothetical protein